MPFADISVVLALVCGLFTAVPGLLPASTLIVVTWSRVLSGLGWLGYAIGALIMGEIPDPILPGVLLAQLGYGAAVFAIATQSCRKR